MNQYQGRSFGLSISFDTETLLIRGIDPLHCVFPSFDPVFAY